MPRAFEQLTKTGQTRRSRALAELALAHFGLPRCRLSLLNDSFNTIFRVHRGGDDDYVLRVHRADGRTLSGLETELAWILALRDAPGAPRVPEPIAAPDGRYLAPLGHPGVPEPRFCSLFRWMPGRPVEEPLRPERVASLGGVARFLHAHTASFRALDGLAPLGDDLFGGFPDVLGTTPFTARLTAQLARARARCETLLAAYAAHPRQLCHLDLHPGNLLRTPDGLAVLDFDDCGLSWPALDLGTLAFYLKAEPDPGLVAELFAALREGYGEGFPSSEDLMGFVLARQLSLLNGVLQDADPRMRDMVPGYLVKVEGRLDDWLAS